MNLKVYQLTISIYFYVLLIECGYKFIINQAIQKQDLIFSPIYGLQEISSQTIQNKRKRNFFSLASFLLIWLHQFIALQRKVFLLPFNLFQKATILFYSTRYVRYKMDDIISNVLLMYFLLLNRI